MWPVLLLRPFPSRTDQLRSLLCERAGMFDDSFDDFFGGADAVPAEARPSLFFYVPATSAAGIGGAKGSTAHKNNALLVAQKALPTAGIELVFPDSVTRANAVTEVSEDAEFDGYTMVFSSTAARDAVVTSMGEARYRFFTVRVKQFGMDGDIVTAPDVHSYEPTAVPVFFSVTVCVSTTEDLPRTPMWLDKGWTLGACDGKVHNTVYADARTLLAINDTFKAGFKRTLASAFT